MLLDALVIAFLLALLAGGRPGRLQNVQLRGTWLFVAAAAVRTVVMWLGVAGSPLMRTLGPALLITTYLALLVALLVNRRLRPLWLVAAGVFCNFLVIAANGGSMPGDRDLAIRAYGPDSPMVRYLDSPTYIIHKAITPQTKLRFLGDVLPLPMVPPRPAWFCPGSIGDVFITLGACWMLLWGMGAFGLGRELHAPRAPAEAVA